MLLADPALTTGTLCRPEKQLLHDYYGFYALRDEIKVKLRNSLLKSSCVLLSSQAYDFFIGVDTQFKQYDFAMVGFNPRVLFTAPEVNPINGKARSIPLLNPFNVYGRVFFFSWFGFMIAFLSW